MATTTKANGKLIAPNFDMEIFQLIAATHAEENVCMSPLLLEALLALLYLGADGSTAEQLKQTLALKRFSSNAKMANYYAECLEMAVAATDTQIELCQKILLNKKYEIADEFKKIAQKYFHTTTEATQSVAGGDADDADGVALISTNFKSKWFLPFSAYRSGIYDFHLNWNEQQTAAVPMLFDDDMFLKFGEFKELDARAIELPYEHETCEMAMLLVLPNKRDGLAALTQQLGALDLSSLAERMQMENVQVLLPKFCIEFECSLRTCLEKLGVASIFSEKANFKNLLQEKCGSSDFKLTNILHKVRLAVNESGSEPSSVVANKPIVLSNSIESRQKFFRADHPFFFVIRNGATTYFMGQVTKF